MEKPTLNDPICVDDLIEAYLRFKEWMDYDTRRAAYAAKEVAVLQELFGTSYVEIPAGLEEASHEELLDVMYERQELLSAYVGALDELEFREESDPEEEDRVEELLHQIDRTSYRTTVHYFRTLHEALQEAARVVMEEGDLPEDSDIYEDQFRKLDADEVEEIRSFILSEHPELAAVTFPLERAYALGLPSHRPEPIEHYPGKD